MFYLATIDSASLPPCPQAVAGFLLCDMRNVTLLCSGYDQSDGDRSSLAREQQGLQFCFSWGFAAGCLSAHLAEASSRKCTVHQALHRLSPHLSHTFPYAVLEHAWWSQPPIPLYLFSLFGMLFLLGRAILFFKV